MGVFDRLFGIDKLVGAEVKAQTAQITKAITERIDANMQKRSNTSLSSPIGQHRSMRYAVDANTLNNNLSSKKKPDSSVPFAVLRRFSVTHEISRAAINYRKRQLSGLDWDIVTEDDDQTTIDQTVQAELKTFFKGIGGPGIKYRKFLNKLVEDLLVLDAVAIEKQPTLGGALYNLNIIDSSTIRLRVDEAGGTPLAPEIAYIQVIRGQKTAEWTTNEMVYDMMNPRSNSPYGLAPLESLMVVVSSSLKAGLYNLGYLTEGNIPEGFFGVPKEWTPQMIKDFQENWDAVMAGDEAATSKLKFTPEGSYQPAKKPNDMAWESFSDWLMKVTCALFDVDPKEIGFHPNKGGLGGSAAAVQGAETSDAKGLVPLAQFVEEIFTEIIQNELGHPDLKFHFKGLVGKDEKLEAEVNEIKIRSGQRTINEIRTDDGLDPDPSPQADQLMISSGTPTFLQTQEQIDAAAETATNIAAGKNPDGSDKVAPPADANTPASDANSGTSDEKTAETTKMVELVGEFRKFRKMAIARKKAGKTFRPFESTVLPTPTLTELNDRIHKAADADEVKAVFGEMMQDYQIEFLADVIALNENLQKVAR